jgi:hypothetical protein
MDLKRNEIKIMLDEIFRQNNHLHIWCYLLSWQLVYIVIKFPSVIHVCFNLPT